MYRNLPAITSEKHARELAKVAPDQQAEVWQAANEAAEAAFDGQVNWRQQGH